MGIHRRHSITRRSLDGRRHGSALGQFGVGLLFVTLAMVSGCRSGTSAFSAPSWWTFGNAAGTDPEKLAAAPPFEGKSADGPITKPSQTATPYPTTTTPNGYSVTDATRGLQNGAVAAATAPVEQAAVTYGSTPPAPPVSPIQPPPAAASTAPMTAATSPVTPTGGAQVGPYATLPGQIPTAGDSQPLAPPPLANAAPSGFPATAGYEPATRMADASSAPAPDASTASRYSSGSRFGGGLEQPPSSPPAAASLLPAAPLTPPPAASAVPQQVPPPLPGAAPSAPPTRRPDPGYRPGGTSSYRPARSILADDQPAPPSAVRTAAYEMPATTQR